MALSQRVLLCNQTVGTLGTTIGFVRSMSKHYDPKFRWLRKMKYIDPRLDRYEKTKENAKRTVKIMGGTARRSSKEVPFYIGSTSDVFDPYVPPEGDGKFSLLPSKVYRDIKDLTTHSSKNVYHTQKIKKYEKDFNSKEFGSQALEIYVNAHNALARKDVNELTNYATEKALHLMLMHTKRTTMKWQYIESLDPPKVVHVRVGQLLSSGNDFGQVTVRFHSKQMLAVYDRFGRLMYGSDILAKDVLEYVVFEKYLVNVYGTWKIHGKIIPDWLPPSEPAPLTYRERLVQEEDDFEEFEDDFKPPTATVVETEEQTNAAKT